MCIPTGCCLKVTDGVEVMGSEDGAEAVEEAEVPCEV